jgi:hypothetical protein
MKTQQKGFIVPLLIVIVVLLVIGGGAYVYSKNKPNTQTDTTTPTKTNQVPPIVTSNWLTYSNAKLGISFKYPPIMGTPSYNETYGILSVTFITPDYKNSLVFQIGGNYLQSEKRYMTLDELVNDQINNPNSGYTDAVKTNIVVDGRNAIQVKAKHISSGDIQTRIYVPVNNKIGNVLTIDQFGYEATSTDKIGIDAILPTLKITK